MSTNPLFFRKLLVAATGLFLCLFLVVHFSANCILLLPENLARGLYNAYSTTLRESPLIKVVAYLLYASIAVHVIYALLITLQNRKAKPVAYALNKHRENSSWASQNMGVLGSLILVFIVIHLANFWARIKLGLGESPGLDANGHVDVYQVTYTLFQNGWYVAFYSLLMIPLGFHLYHGLQSGFKTLGFYHSRGLKWLAKAALVYALVLSIGFGIIPIIVCLK